MALKLMYISNDPVIARVVEKSGVDWLFIDLEHIGKKERQGHLDAVISNHQLSDIEKIRRVVGTTSLLVRTNPIHDRTRQEVNDIISAGADIVMLPYFKTRDEVSFFLNSVRGRVKTCLLCETVEAVNDIDHIIDLPGIDYIHIGLNDLHLAYGMDFMFELLADGTVECLCRKFMSRKMIYGFGGIARPGEGALPGENVIAEHYRLGSTMAILSRTFCNAKETTDNESFEESFINGVHQIRELEKSLATRPPSFFAENTHCVQAKVQFIKNEIIARRSSSKG